MLPLCITADSEGFVALHQHGNGHLRSYKLTFVMHNGVTKSKRKIWVLVYSILLKWPPILLAWNGLFLLLSLPFLFYKSILAWNFCRMFNDKCPWKRNWREMKFPSGWKLKKRCSGLPSKSHKLCSRYKRQHVPKSVLDICSWSFLYTFYSPSY